jgi:hypothetical protein
VSAGARIMSKSQMKYANRAWRKATASWGMNKKNHRAFCRENAQITVQEYCGRGDDFQCQGDADYQVAEELTYWGNDARPNSTKRNQADYRA